MKKKIFIALVVVLTASLTSQVVAQETMEVTKQRTKSNSTNERSSAQSSVCTGKITCADGTCSVSFDQEVVSPRDAASGLPTGKRMHKPFVITKELDRSASTGVRESPTTSSSGKASYSDLSIMCNVKGKQQKLQVVNGRFAMPADCPDGTYDLVCSWSWGQSNGGSSRYEATLNLDVVSGEYMASKHTKTGHVTLLK